MPIFDFSQITSLATPILTQTLNLVWQIAKLLLILAGLALVWFYMSYNVRVLERKYTKGGRVIAMMKRAKKVIDKKLGHPQLKFLGFKGKTLNEPSADCIIPFQSLIGNTTMYEFVIKEGIYYPIANAVLGRKYIIDSSQQLQQDDKFIEWAKENGIEVTAVGNPTDVVYSIEGSGLEVSRDFEGEQASLNNLINAAEKYKNRKPIEIAAMYGLMIIIVVGAFITIIYAFYKTGQLIPAINAVGEKLFSAVGQTKLGPG